MNETPQKTVKFYLDTEFIEAGRHSPIQLISIGIVSEDGREFYAESQEFDPKTLSPWLRENVLPHLGPIEDRMPVILIAQKVCEFVGSCKPEFWGYYADYDWVVFCQMFGSMIDLPKGWPMYCRDIKQLCDSLGNPKLPENKGAEHNALSDAKWNETALQLLLSAQSNAGMTPPLNPKPSPLESPGGDRAAAHVLQSALHEIVSILGNYMPRKGSLVDQAIAVAEAALGTETPLASAGHHDQTQNALKVCPFCECDMPFRGDFDHPSTDKRWTAHPFNKCVLAGMWFNPEAWNKRAEQPVDQVSETWETIAAGYLTLVSIRNRIHETSDLYIDLQKYFLRAIVESHLPVSAPPVSEDSASHAEEDLGKTDADVNADHASKQKWLPIESAPRDGLDIIGAVLDYVTGEAVGVDIYAWGQIFEEPLSPWLGWKFNNGHLRSCRTNALDAAPFGPWRHRRTPCSFVNSKRSVFSLP